MGLGETGNNTSYSDELDFFLEKLSKVILLNSSFSNHMGLYDGKTGAALFLYHLEQYNGKDVYYNLANELILEIIKGLNAENINFTSGIVGIGWGIDYCIKNDFIDAPDGSDIFSNIDLRVIREAKTFDFNVESIGISAYVYNSLNRVAPEEEDLEILLKKERIIQHLEKMELDLLALTAITEKQFFNEFNADDSWTVLTGKLANMVVLIDQDLNEKIYPHMMDSITEKYFNAVTKLLNCLFKIIEQQHDLAVSKGFILLFQLTKLYNAYLKLALKLNEHLRSDEFINAVTVLEELLAGTAGLLYRKQNVQAEIQRLMLFSHLNAFLGNPLLNRYTKHGTSLIIGSFMAGQSDFMKYFINDDKSLNVGISGLSGLGLLILQQKSFKRQDWVEAFLID